MIQRQIFILAATWIIGASVIPQQVAAQFCAIRANALTTLTGTFNFGIDVSVADKWTVDLSGYWNPINTDTYSTKFYGVQIGTKHWLYESFVGHFFGSQLTYASYRWGGKKYYYKGHMGGVGFSYGYTWMLSKRWNLTIEAGVGLYYMKDTRCDRLESEYEPTYIRHYKRLAIGPSRAEVSFSYLF